MHSNKCEDLFSIYYYSQSDLYKKGDILYVHPFGDEMNKSRRIVALQAQSFAQAGFGVLQIDLLGCGDSEGDFNIVTWEKWKNNIDEAIHWLKNIGSRSISLWGLRLGALLMMDWVKEKALPIESYIFWQPVLNGDLALKQSLRLVSASRALGKDGESSKELQEKMRQGQAIEIGGYTLNSDLALAMGKIKMEELIPPAGSRIIWKEISLKDSPIIAPPSRKLINIMESQGCRVEAESISGNAFWNSIEIAVLPDLIKSTTESMS